MFRVKSLGRIGLALLGLLAAMFPFCEAARADEGDFATATKAEADFATTIEATIASVSKATSGAAEIRLEASPQEADFTRDGLTIGEAILATHRGGSCAGGSCGPIFSGDGGGGLLRRAAGAPLRIFSWAAPLRRLGNWRPFGGRFRLRG